MSLHRPSLALAAVALAATGLTACGSGEEECVYEPPQAVIEQVDGPGTINQDHNFTARDSFASCDRTLSYSWTWVRVPDGSGATDALWIGNGTPAGVDQVVNPDEPGTYVLGLAVFDGVQSSTETVQVLRVASDNLPPEADAGMDQSVQVNGRAVFDGTESYDPELREITYRWTLESSPEGSTRTSKDIFDADRAQAAFVPDVAGDYVFSLQVEDEFTVSEKDYVTLVAIGDDQPPVAEASGRMASEFTLPACASQDPIQLNGSRSWDPEGEPLTYEWGVVSVPAGSSAGLENFDDRMAERPRFTTDVPGRYVFDLRVHDGDQWSPWDEVTYNTTALVENVPPTADAGENIEIEVEARCYNFAGSFKCGNCPLPVIELDATGTTDPNGDSLNYLWLQTSGPEATIDYPEGPVTRFIPGNLEGEYERTVTRTWDLQVRATDCTGESTDDVRVTFRCRGESR
jgi:hypothetical protein